MRLCFHAHAWEDYLYWQATDRKKLRRINELIRDVLRHPLEGLGKPEPLKHELAGAWSRRVDQEHRLVCVLEKDMVVILPCRMHY